MSISKLLERKLELETELDDINAKLKAKYKSDTKEIVTAKGLQVTISWIAPTKVFHRKDFEADNPRLVNRLAQYCSHKSGYHTVSKVKRLKREVS